MDGMDTESLFTVVNFLEGEKNRGPKEDDSPTISPTETGMGVKVGEALDRMNGA